LVFELTQGSIYSAQQIIESGFFMGAELQDLEFQTATHNRLTAELTRGNKYDLHRILTIALDILSPDQLQSPEIEKARQQTEHIL
jgi:hypothetical protein